MITAFAIVLLIVLLIGFMSIMSYVINGDPLTYMMFMMTGFDGMMDIIGLLISAIIDGLGD